MKIGIEAQRIFRKKKHGMDMVAVELIKNLQKIDSENEYYVFVKPDEDPCIQETENFKIVEVEGGSYPVWEQKHLPDSVKKYGCQILHCTSNTAPLNPGCKLVVTLHDIIYMEKSCLGIVSGKGTNYQKFGNIYRRLVVPQIMKKADRIITVSEFEKNRISDFFGVNGSRLVSVYNGVGEHFKKISDKEEITRVRQTYNLPEKYFFFLGNTDPKKNTRGVIKAYSDYISKTGNKEKLVLLDFDKNELDKMIRSENAENIRDMIHLTGYVVNTDLPVIYSEASLFLYPSLRESFGIPILEAMRCETPVITSNTSSMPEIGGDAAWFVNPYHTQEITNAMIKVLEDTVKRGNLVSGGLKRSVQFSWPIMAKTVQKIYKELN